GRLRIPKRRLQVVEDETDGGTRPSRRSDRQFPVTRDEDAALTGRDLQLGQRRVARAHLLGRREQVGRRLCERIARRQRRAENLALVVEHDRSFDLRRDLGQVGERLLCIHRLQSRVRPVRVRRRDLVAKFFGDRGTHLAAMIAYFALLSFVPLTFLALSLLGLSGRADESSFLVREIKRTLPGTPIDRILGLVHTVQDNAAALGIIGGAALIWTSLSLFSALESAFNIVYGRPNRSFLHGKGLATILMVGALGTLFVSLLAGSLGVSAVRDYAPGFVGNVVTAYAVSIAVSLVGIFIFLVSCYYALTNAVVTVREVLPGAVFATILLEATFQVLPFYQRYADVNPGLRAFGAPAILLVWLYVMSNIIVFGAEINWWRSRRLEQRAIEELPGLA